MRDLLIIVALLVVLFLVSFATYPGCFARARLLELMGLEDAAATTYEKITDRAPSSSWADRSESRLAALSEPDRDAAEEPEKPEKTAKDVPVAKPTPSPVPEVQPTAAPKAAKSGKEEKRVDPSYGGPLGAYWKAKNKIEDVQKKHNEDLTGHLQD